jgi:hypothetical protein
VGAAHGGASSCVSPSDASLCDDEGGVDNGGLRGGLTTFAAAIEDQVTANVACGRSAMLVQLTHYDGLDDDPDVSVALGPSWGIVDPHPAGEDPASLAKCFLPSDLLPDGGVPEGGPYPVRRDGTDRWSVPPSNVVGTSVLTNAFHGYVVNRQLVVVLSSPDRSVGWNVVVANTLLPMSSAILRADIVQAGSLLRLEHGVLTARVDSDDLLSAVGSLRAEADTYACEEPFYPQLKTAVCASPDLLISQSRDFSGDTCNAISFVMQFSAGQGLIGSILAAPTQIGERCAVNFRDSCSKP